MCMVFLNKFFPPLGNCQEVQLLCRVARVFCFVRNCRTLFPNESQCCNPTNNDEPMVACAPSMWAILTVAPFNLHMSKDMFPRCKILHTFTRFKIHIKLCFFFFGALVMCSLRVCQWSQAPLLLANYCSLFKGLSLTLLSIVWLGCTQVWLSLSCPIMNLPIPCTFHLIWKHFDF